jgi:hypothetical protein
MDKKLYAVLLGMRGRCNNPNNKAYPNYGGRGIKVCQEWSNPAKFISWAKANGYEPGLTIERKNNDKGYSPSNCRFATRTDQNRNKRGSTYQYTIEDLDKDFPDEDSCLEHIFQERYGDLTVCPNCNTDTKFYRLTGRKSYACMRCRHQLNPLADTMFHKSDTPLKTWFYAIYLLGNENISAKELERKLNVTYKTAYRIKKLVACLPVAGVGENRV